MNLLETPIKLPKFTSLKHAAMPTKTTLNLCVREKSPNRPGRVIPALICCVVFVALFARFGVIGRWQAAAEAEAKAQQVQLELAQLQEYTQNYEQLRLEYARYFADGGGATTLADRMDLLAMVENPLMAAGRVEYFTVTENVLSAKLSGVALADTAGILARLYQYELVQDVSVYTADKDTDTAIPSVLMTITVGNQPVQEEETP